MQQQLEAHEFAEYAREGLLHIGETIDIKAGHRWGYRVQIVKKLRA